MVSFQDRNFLVASIPTHRRDVHLKKWVALIYSGISGSSLLRLLAQGYRVGIVNQIETAALKKIGDNKSGPFERQLTKLFTSATFVACLGIYVDIPNFRARYVDDLNSVDELERYTPPPFMCLVEDTKENDPQNVSISLISICPTTGDVIWDEFTGTLASRNFVKGLISFCVDTAMRIELEVGIQGISNGQIF